MASMILAEATANVSDLQQNPTATLATGHGLPVAILDHGQPLFYCLLDRLEDLELNALADARLGDGQPIVKVSLDEL